jgi:hypothetical protein
VRRADHSSRGVLPSVVCLSVIVKPRQRGGPGPLGAVAPWKKERMSSDLEGKWKEAIATVSGTVPEFA